MAAAGVLRAPSTSALGVLSFLEEPDNELKYRALQHIYKIVDLHWAEICDHLATIEELSEDPSFVGADLAAAIASKCFYYLQEQDDALRLGMCAGKYFNINERSEYVECLLARCIDEYSSLCHQKEKDTSVEIDPKMTDIMEQLFKRCYADGCFEQAMGIALDAHRLDKVEEVCRAALAVGGGNNDSDNNIIAYTFDVCLGARNIVSREFRLATISILVKLCKTALTSPDYPTMCFGHQLLNQPKEFADILVTLLQGTPEDALLAYQIAFDLQETENQGFVLQVVAQIPQLNVLTTDTAAAASAGVEESKEGDMDVETPTPAVAAPDPAAAVALIAPDRVKKLRRVLLEALDVDLLLNFLFKQSRVDNNILKALKVSTDGKSSILHNAVVVAHAYMNAGTTRDVFLRENLDWLGKASNWAKFTAVGSIGVVHKGQVHLSMQLLAPYLPVQGRSSSPYSEAGALYALGLIHASKGGAGDSKTITYLTDALRNSGNNAIVQHGACLGIGLAGMATGNDALYDELRQILFTDSAAAGEGAALGIGLLLLGQSDSPLAQNCCGDLLNYAHDTAHEKIIRGLGLAIAMMVYGKEESADVLIEQLVRDRDPIIRYGGMFAIAMAFCGTSDNGAVKRLLHVAVSDVNDDVRRAAVMSIGFVMFKNPAIVPKLVSLLSESFNPHVRYGAALAVGIACSGSALKDATDLLYGMLGDSVDFVKQGVYMSLALVLMETSEARTSVVKKFRDHLKDIVNDKHQTVLAKSGAVLATGILDAGGRNVVMSMQSRSGVMKMGAAVGCMLWLQHWYWYPMMLTLSLAYTPTIMVGLNENFDMPVSYGVRCNAPPSVFAYPQADERKEDEKKFIATAVLSTTAKAKARVARKEAKKHGGSGVPASPGGAPSLQRTMSMQSDSGEPSDKDGIPLQRVYSNISTTSYLSLEAVDGGEKAAEETKPKEKKEKEPTSFMLANPCRVTPAQVKYVSTVADSGSSGYMPVRQFRKVRQGQMLPAPVGVVMLVKTNEIKDVDEEVTKVEVIALGAGSVEEEAAPFEPFEWTDEA